MDRFRAIVIGLTITLVASAARASGHGPVFGATTPTLGRGGWSIDQAWTIRDAGADQSEQMFKTMISFGVRCRQTILKASRLLLSVLPALSTL